MSIVAKSLEVLVDDKNIRVIFNEPIPNFPGYAVQIEPANVQESTTHKIEQPTNRKKEDITDFYSEVTKKISSVAKAKGYLIGPLDNLFTEDEIEIHRIGEMVYKLQRYRNQKNADDIVKVAAWAYLIWRDKIRREDTTLGPQDADGQDQH